MNIAIIMIAAITATTTHIDTHKHPHTQYLHAHSYRNAESYKNQHVLIVGGSHSGIDIGNEISAYSASTTVSCKLGEKYDKLWNWIYESVANKRSNEPNNLHLLKRVGEITHIDSDGYVYFNDGITVPQQYDRIIFATGYTYVCPFLSKQLQISDNELYKYIFHPQLADGTLSFAGIPIVLKYRYNGYLRS